MWLVRLMRLMRVESITSRHSLVHCGLVYPASRCGRCFLPRRRDSESFHFPTSYLKPLLSHNPFALAICVLINLDYDYSDVHQRCGRRGLHL